MTIAKLARAAEVGVETVRYYQRRGLLPVPRAGGAKGTASAFRHYEPSHVQTLRFIRRAQAAGFTLEEIKELLSLDRTRDRARIRVLAGARLEALARQARELEEARQGLQRLLGACRGSNRGPCPIIEAFSPDPVA
jgi:MerR family mercuric resistance operon transcriptional regulator